MNAPFLPELRDQRRRAVEVEFLTERYHRAFDEEAASLAAIATLVGADELARALDAVRCSLALHEHLQEQRLFPAYEHGSAIDAPLYDAWLTDSATIADATTALRAVSVAPPHARLRERALHFASEIERHLVDEVEVFAAWAGHA